MYISHSTSYTAYILQNIGAKQGLAVGTLLGLARFRKRAKCMYINELARLNGRRPHKIPQDCSQDCVGPLFWVCTTPTLEQVHCLAFCLPPDIGSLLS
jgi:hypothetical protein